MNTSLYLCRIGAVALTLCGLLPGCDGHGGAVVRLFFGTNNIGNCDGVTVELDIGPANAVLAHRKDGSVDCALNVLLDGSGCDVAFSEINGGDTLRAAISGCEVPAVTNLFQCGFTKADIAGLEAATSAECPCADTPVCSYNWVCDESPSICISQNWDPAACENCGNDRDDDGNGLVDCSDPNCAHTMDCGWGQSTITCSSTTISTADTTTTSLPAAASLGTGALPETSHSRPTLAPTQAASPALPRPLPPR